jgi:methionyl-tRNA formyltransferase
VRLERIAMLAAPNARSAAYLERLGKDGLTPAFAIVLSEAANAPSPGSQPGRPAHAFLRLLREMDVPHLVIPASDINAPETVAAVRMRPEEFFIYSGPGGTILGREILGLGKRFIHVHPGRLPGFRGSTTVYYQLLASPTVGATAIFLEGKIDQGPVLAAREFPPPRPDEDLDYGYDPRVRAEVLAEVLGRFALEGAFRPAPQPGGGETYFIMHPVLRHIAKLKVSR